MDRITGWGYNILNCEQLPDMLTQKEFDEITNFKYADDRRVAPNIRAAQAAMRNWCGWHIGPSLDCQCILKPTRANVSFSGDDMLIQLPATFICDVSRVLLSAIKLDGDWIGEESTWDLESNGLLRVYHAGNLHPTDTILAEYKAGCSLDMLYNLQDLIAHRVTHALSSPEGVQTEQAGGLSVTYHPSWIISARASALPDSNQQVLLPYRLRGVF